MWSGWSSPNTRFEAASARSIQRDRLVEATLRSPARSAGRQPLRPERVAVSSRPQAGLCLVEHALRPPPVTAAHQRPRQHHATLGHHGMVRPEQLFGAFECHLGKAVSAGAVAQLDQQFRQCLEPIGIVRVILSLADVAAVRSWVGHEYARERGLASRPDDRLEQGLGPGELADYAEQPREVGRGGIEGTAGAVSIACLFLYFLNGLEPAQRSRVIASKPAHVCQLDNCRERGWVRFPDRRPEDRSGVPACRLGLIEAAERAERFPPVEERHGVGAVGRAELRFEQLRSLAEHWLGVGHAALGQESFSALPECLGVLRMALANRPATEFDDPAQHPRGGVELASLAERRANVFQVRYTPLGALAEQLSPDNQGAELVSERVTVATQKGEPARARAVNDDLAVGSLGPSQEVGIIPGNDRRLLSRGEAAPGVCGPPVVWARAFGKKRRDFPPRGDCLGELMPGEVAPRQPFKRFVQGGVVTAEGFPFRLGERADRRDVPFIAAAAVRRDRGDDIETRGVSGCELTVRVVAHPDSLHGRWPRTRRPLGRACLEQSFLSTLVVAAGLACAGQPDNRADGARVARTADLVIERERLGEDGLHLVGVPGAAEHQPEVAKEIDGVDIRLPHKLRLDLVGLAQVRHCLVRFVRAEPEERRIDQRPDLAQAGAQRRGQTLHARDLIHCEAGVDRLPVLVAKEHAQRLKPLLAGLPGGREVASLEMQFG